ncbi:MAG: hotdog fold thioesterase [Micrococcaceae bacterium]
MSTEKFGRGVGPLAEKMGIELVSATPEKIIGTMPVKGNTQPFGILHGGAHVVLAESLGSVGAWLHGQTIAQGSRAVGIEVSATHHKSVTQGVVTGTAEAIHLGKTLAHYNIVMEDEEGRRLSTAKLTAMILPPQK